MSLTGSPQRSGKRGPARRGGAVPHRPAGRAAGRVRHHPGPEGTRRERL